MTIPLAPAEGRKIASEWMRRVVRESVLLWGGTCVVRAWARAKLKASESSGEGEMAKDGASEGMAWASSLRSLLSRDKTPWLLPC
jgi:hypothetical protein